MPIKSYNNNDLCGTYNWKQLYGFYRENIPSDLYNLISCYNENYKSINIYDYIESVHFIMQSKTGIHLCGLFTVFNESKEFAEGLWNIVPVIDNKIICVSMFDPIEYASHYYNKSESIFDFGSFNIFPIEDTLYKLSKEIIEYDDDLFKYQNIKKDTGAIILNYINPKSNKSLLNQTISFNLCDLKDPTRHDGMISYSIPALLTGYRKYPDRYIDKLPTSKEIIGITVIELT